MKGGIIIKNSLTLLLSITVLLTFSIPVFAAGDTDSSLSEDELVALEDLGLEPEEIVDVIIFDCETEDFTNQGSKNNAPSISTYAWYDTGYNYYSNGAGREITESVAVGGRDNIPNGAGWKTTISVTFSHNYSISGGFSLGVSDKSSLSATAGYGYTTSRTISKEFSYTNKSGRSVTVAVYPKRNRLSFSVYGNKSGDYLGSVSFQPFSGYVMVVK